jgi:hypothetical protein
MWWGRRVLEEVVQPFRPLAPRNIDYKPNNQNKPAKHSAYLIAIWKRHRGIISPNTGF